MSVARVTQLISSSPKSFDEAMRLGVERANQTLENVKGAWIKDMKLDIENGKVTNHRVVLKVTFVLKS